MVRKRCLPLLLSDINGGSNGAAAGSRSALPSWASRQASGGRAVVGAVGAESSRFGVPFGVAAGDSVISLATGKAVGRVVSAAPGSPVVAAMLRLDATGLRPSGVALQPLCVVAGCEAGQESAAVGDATIKAYGEVHLPCWWPTAEA